MALGSALARGAMPHEGIAFNYSAAFSAADIDWYSRFSILVTGGILSPKVTAALVSRGLKLIAYEWSSAFYPGDPVSAAPLWQSMVGRNGRRWLLNAEPAGGAAAEPGRAAFWYDFGAPELISAPVEHLARQLEEHGYAGYFFDTLGFAHLPAGLQNEFRRRHPAADYEMMQGQFLKKLRARLPGKLIFSNQGYRNAAAYLPHVDLDASESSFTFLDSRGATVLRPFWNPRAPWESISVPLAQLIGPASRAYPHVRFVHVNYASPPSTSVQRAIRYSFACARLWGHQSYLIAPGVSSEERHDVYFSDLGQPLTAQFEQDAARGIAWRVFQRGVVAIHSGMGSVRIPSLNIELPDGPVGCVFLR